MASIPFDTLKAFKELQDAGFDEAQAEAVIATIGIAFGGDLATKQDIAEVSHNMATKADIRDMATKQDIRDMATKADIQDMATKADIQDMATKQDIADVRSEMATKQDIADVRRDMATKEEVASVRREMATKADLHALEVRLMVRLGGLFVAVAGVTVAAVRLLS